MAGWIAPDTLRMKMEERCDTLEPFIWRGGSCEKPPTNKNHLRLYSHNLCPFVARVRYTLACKEIPFQMVYLDLQNKAQWHKDYNGGTVPILEKPDGSLENESAQMMAWAIESQAGKGIDLMPADSKPAMDEKEALFSDSMATFWPILKTRYQDMSKIDEFLAAGGAAEKWNALCDTNGKFLLGTDELTLVDIKCGTLWELQWHGIHSDVNSVAAARLDLQKNAPHWWAFMERFRAHPKVAPLCMNLKAAAVFNARVVTHDPNEKCQLSIPEIAAAFPELL